MTAAAVAASTPTVIVTPTYNSAIICAIIFGSLVDVRNMSNTVYGRYMVFTAIFAVLPLSYIYISRRRKDSDAVTVASTVAEDAVDDETEIDWSEEDSDNDDNDNACDDEDNLIALQLHDVRIDNDVSLAYRRIRTIPMSICSCIDISAIVKLDITDCRIKSLKEVSMLRMYHYLYQLRYLPKCTYIHACT